MAITDSGLNLYFYFIFFMFVMETSCGFIVRRRARPTVSESTPFLRLSEKGDNPLRSIGM